MPKGPFLPTEFTATKFSTAADKAEFGNHFLRFIESEWAQALFHQGLLSPPVDVLRAYCAHG